MLIQVPTIQTTFEVSDFTKAFIKAWLGIYGSYPSKASIGVIYGQYGVETGIGKYCWNNNISNVKAIDIPGQEVKYAALNGVWEVINGQKVEIPITSPGSWFRAFDTFSEGVSFYLDFLRGTRYKNAFTAIEQGNPSSFSHLLKIEGYYTAPEASYTALLTSYFNQFMKMTDFEQALQEIQAEQSPPEPEPIVHPDIPIDVQPIEEPIQPAPVPQPSTNLFTNLFNKVKSIFSK